MPQRDYLIEVGFDRFELDEANRQKIVKALTDCFEDIADIERFLIGLKDDFAPRAADQINSEHSVTEGVRKMIESYEQVQRLTMLLTAIQDQHRKNDVLAFILVMLVQKNRKAASAARDRAHSFLSPTSAPTTDGKEVTKEGGCTSVD